MKEFNRAYRRLLDQPQNTIRREIGESIDAGGRLICIRGTRGIGKTTFLLEYARENFEKDSPLCTYVNLNHFYFSTNTLYDFIRDFYDGGGRTILIDQIFKYPEWEEEIIKCYREMSELQIIFTASSVMDIEHDNPRLRGMVQIYDLRGFSFREYLNYHHSLALPKVSLNELLDNHTEIASAVVNRIHPYEDFKRYLKVGYYPPMMDITLFGENLVKNMNMLLEVDVVYIRQIEPTYLYKLRKLLYLIANQPKGVTNVTSLSQEIGTSRATVMNYLKYLSDAELVRLIYKEGGEYPKKPDRVYLNDTNIASVMYPNEQPDEMMRKIFLLSQLRNAGYTVHHPEQSGADFLVNGKYNFRTTDVMRRRSQGTTYYAIENMVIGDEDQIPLWLFGFLY